MSGIVDLQTDLPSRSGKVKRAGPRRITTALLDCLIRNRVEQRLLPVAHEPKKALRRPRGRATRGLRGLRGVILSDTALLDTTRLRSFY